MDHLQQEMFIINNKNTIIIVQRESTTNNSQFQLDQEALIVKINLEEDLRSFKILFRSKSQGHQMQELLLNRKQMMI